MKNKLKYFRGLIRVFWGFCPKCNSSAPHMYDCNVCSNYDNSYPFPPSKKTKRLWLHNYRIDLRRDIPKFKIGDTVVIKINKDVPDDFVHTYFSEGSERFVFTVTSVNECFWVHGISHFWYGGTTADVCAYEEDLIKIG